MEKFAAIYIRVSTLDQAREGYSLDAQERTLRKWCAEHEYAVYDVYADKGISGKDIDHRPDMQRLLSDAQDRQFDLILVWALSRFTRSVSDLYTTLELLRSYDVTFISHTEAFDTGTAMGRAMVGICGVFAQLERELTSERVSAAITERATQGKRTCNEVLGYDLDGKDSFLVNPQDWRMGTLVQLATTCIVPSVDRACKDFLDTPCCLDAPTLASVPAQPTQFRHCREAAELKIPIKYVSHHLGLVSVDMYNRVQHLLGKSRAGRHRVTVLHQLR